MRAFVLSVTPSPDGKSKQAACQVYYDDPGVTGEQVIAGQIMADTSCFEQSVQVGQIWDVTFTLLPPAYGQ
jgi:hypothetical protein